MPRGDRTGRNGAGPLTGRGLGFCAGFDAPGYMQGGPGWRRGYGRAFRFHPYAAYSTGYRYMGPPQLSEHEVLTQEALALEEELKAIKERLVKVEMEGKG